AHGDGAYDTVAELLLHFKRQAAVFKNQRVIDARNRVAREFDVDDRADDLNNLAVTHGNVLNKITRFLKQKFFPYAGLAYEMAAAPPTISDSSCVIAAWRALLYSSCSDSISSPALSDAAFIATMRAAISQATFSTAPW